MSIPTSKQIAARLAFLESQVLKLGALIALDIRVRALEEAIGPAPEPEAAAKPKRKRR